MARSWGYQPNGRSRLAPRPGTRCDGMTDQSAPPPPPGGQAGPRSSGLIVPLWLMALALAVLAIVGVANLLDSEESDIPAESMCTMLGARMEDVTIAVRQVGRELCQLPDQTAVGCLYPCS